MFKVFLPKTEFNIYEKNIEEELLKYWEDINLFNLRNKKRVGQKTFVLHDGPPYANGAIHMGHAQNKIWKDILNKIFWQSGYDVKYILGWDAHGLPIENAVEKKLAAEKIDKKKLTKQEFWDECLKFANYWMNEQKKGFKKLGVFADFEKPYVTFAEEESIGIIECIHNFVKSGYLIQKYRPVLWSYVEKTALAYAEVEYKEKISNSIYISFKIVDTIVSDLIGVSLIIWTTTPWTLPCNEAVSYNENFTYLIFEADCKKYSVEKSLFKDIKSFFKKVKILKEVSGIVFDNAIVEHCIEEFNIKSKKRKLLHSNHVDNERGTGFVHLAPGHGEEDFEVCKKNNINIEDYFDFDGCFLKSVPIFANMHVKLVDNAIITLLKDRGLLLKEEKTIHSYPHSWRSKAPLIYRLTKQWFLNIKEIKNNALKVARDSKLNWFPVEAKNRFFSMLETRDDWCISRQRIWGVPLAIFYNIETGKVLDDPIFLKKTRDYLFKKGIKNWDKIQIEKIDSEYSSKFWKRVDDIVDIWFESGATHHFVLQKHNIFPADIYLEGSDQHRGWFQSSMLISATQSNSAPWKNLITHGFCLDSSKQKMSKSIGNIVDPLSWDIDTLRVYFASLHLTSDISLSKESIVNANDMVFRFKNTIKFLLGNLAISKEIEDVEFEKLPILEQWILHKLHEIDILYDDILNNFYLHDFINKLYEFCSIDLSSFYFDICKDSLYCDVFDDFQRKSIITVFRIITPALIRYLSNFMPYSMEKAWLIYLRENNLALEESIHLQDRVVISEHYKNDALNLNILKIKEIKRLVNEKIERLRLEKKVNTSYETKVFINFESDFVFLKRIFIVSEVVFAENFDVVVMIGDKCNRCKFLYEKLEDDQLCKRCFEALKVI